MAAYYLKIVAMFHRPKPTVYARQTDLSEIPPVEDPYQPAPIVAAIVLSVGATLMFGTLFRATDRLVKRTEQAARIESLPDETPVAASILAR